LIWGIIFKKQTAMSGINKKTGTKQLRLNTFVAEKLGFKVKLNDNRYYLTKKQKKKYLEMDFQPVKRLFFDIETSPIIAYTWRVGWKLNIPADNIIEDWKVICISYKFEGDENVKTLTWDERPM